MHVGRDRRGPVERARPHVAELGPAVLAEDRDLALRAPEHGLGAAVVARDAEDARSETDWVAATVRDFGGIDALVHNAGILSTRSVIDADDAEVDRLLEVNVKSPLRLTRKAWPHLLAADEGKVLVMASLAAKRVRTADASLYALSKAAVLSLAHGIRHCGAESRVRCTALCPGFVATDMAAGLPPEQQRQATRPEDVARIARTVLELPASASVAEIPISWTVEPQY